MKVLLKDSLEKIELKNLKIELKFENTIMECSINLIEQSNFQIGQVYEVIGELEKKKNEEIYLNLRILNNLQGTDIYLLTKMYQLRSS